jgi:head-tail adaptor
VATVTKIWQSGMLDHRIIISNPKYIKDAHGEISEAVPDQYKIWANRVDSELDSVTENEKAYQVVASGKTKFIIRYKKWLNERCLITDHSTNDVFEITGITVLGRNEGQSILCKNKDNLKANGC